MENRKITGVKTRLYTVTLTLIGSIRMIAKMIMNTALSIATICWFRKPRIVLMSDVQRCSRSPVSTLTW